MMKMKFLKAVKEILNKLGYDLKKVSNQFPAESTPEEKELIESSCKYSTTGIIRMWALVQSIKYIHKKNIDGDMVECGIWKGGNVILMKKMIEKYNLKNKVYGYDTFEGMPDATIWDIDYKGNDASNLMRNSKKDESVRNIHAYASLTAVENNIRDSVGSMDGINLIQGKVEETLREKKNLPKKISILRLDTDWYESTKAELETLYPRVEKGGIVIIDDYGHFKGAKKAVDEYFGDQKPFMHYVDYTCRLFIKD